LVTKISTTLTLTSGHNPVANGKGLTLRAGVIASANATNASGPGNTVTFLITGQAGDTVTCTGGSNVIMISTTATNQGLASCPIAAGLLVAVDAPYAVQAIYSGDSKFGGSMGTLTQGVTGP
jgi:hypothetical protein